MNDPTPALYAGIAGGVLGLLGGLAGTAVGIANTRGPRERAFAVRCAVLMWAAMAVCLTTGFLLPAPFGSLAMLPLFLAMPWAMPACNRRLEALRRADAAGTGG